MPSTPDWIRPMGTRGYGKSHEPPAGASGPCRTRARSGRSPVGAEIVAHSLQLRQVQDPLPHTRITRALTHLQDEEQRLRIFLRHEAQGHPAPILGFARFTSMSTAA
jgi:hypothetical protein